MPFLSVSTIAFASLLFYLYQFSLSLLLMSVPVALLFPILAVFNSSSRDSIHPLLIITATRFSDQIKRLRSAADHRHQPTRQEIQDFARRSGGHGGISQAHSNQSLVIRWTAASAVSPLPYPLLLVSSLTKWLQSTRCAHFIVLIRFFNPPQSQSQSGWRNCKF